MDQDRNQDRERLREVHRTEQTESKLNEDFVEWLKTKGPSWLLMLLIVLTVYLGMVRWRDSRAQHEAQAWAALLDEQVAGLPSSLESIAEQYPRVGSVSILARLHAAERLLNSVQLGVPLDALQEIYLDDDFDEDDLPRLTSEERVHYLDRADGLYQKVLEADDGSQGKALYAISAHNGRAAVAEARGDTDRARELYERAMQRAETHYPELAKQAQRRIDTLGDAAAAISFPRRRDIVTDEVDAERRPVQLDPNLQDLLLTDDDLATALDQPTLPPDFSVDDLPDDFSLDDLPADLREAIEGQQQQPPGGLPPTP